ncbi:MAG: Histidine ammonia-lyase [Fimbriimonadaceae bacterium]|nr:Histidine ammonia-lyase [Fimbriimonadaceae bacterium]
MIELDGSAIPLAVLRRIADATTELRLSEPAKIRMLRAVETVRNIVESGEPAYGVNTGFGRLSDVTIPRDEIEQLQLNLVRSHACGVGEPLPVRDVRAMMALRANVLAKGHSGARIETAELLLAMLNRGLVPVIPSRGSVGASGDLAPLAHLAMALIGEGEVFANGRRQQSADALAGQGLSPLKLQAKEGLALLNGTQAMCAVGGLALERARRLVETADLAGAMTLDALLGTPVAFDERIHDLRPHSGQSASARRLREYLAGSQIRESHLQGDPRVQDAYSLRCMPQVHGAVQDAIDHAIGVVETETGSATDNPLIFPETGDVLSGGNFHGAPVAMALDYAAIALTSLMAISERRIDRLINPDLNEHLPPFLSQHPGSSSGFMIPHVVAVSLLNEARVLAHPASCDNAPTSGGKEDHVSMGMTAASKLRTVVDHATLVLAIELIVAAEGLEYRHPLRSGVAVEEAFAKVRSLIPRLEQDRPLTKDIESLAERISVGL